MESFVASSGLASAVRFPLALGPVLGLLIVFIFMDSFKLIPLRAVLRSILVGCLAAVLASFLNTYLIDLLGMSRVGYSRYLAPFVEEGLKVALLVYLIRARKVGFPLDAAIYGFAVGTGFALVENVYYLARLGDEVSLVLWIVRGFGTAVMHGSTAAVFGILSKGLVHRHSSLAPRYFLPGFLAAVLIHSLYNHFLLPPVLMTGLVMVVLPVLVMAIFDRSEAATRRWLGAGLDTDVELLELMNSGQIRESPMGEYLSSLRATFPGPVVADLLCLLQIHAELAVRAKGLLMAREAGVDVPVGEDVKARFEELRYLEKAVGKTGLLAIQPIQRQSSQDLWQLYILESSS